MQECFFWECWKATAKQADKFSLDWLKLTESIIIIKRAHRGGLLNFEYLYTFKEENFF